MKFVLNKNFLYKSLFCFLFIVICSFSLYAQISEPSPADKGMAAEEFRRGVQAYYRGAFNDAILQFEKALAFIPDEPLILNWLGKSYYKAGFESTALDQWKFVSDLEPNNILLQNKIEIISHRRLASEFFSKETRYVNATTFVGGEGENLFFSQPISVFAQPNGKLLVLAYGSNELLTVDVNGSIISRNRGPLNGFDRPMDIIQTRDGNLLVTEYAGDRISKLSQEGNFILSFGKKGIGEGELLGPQFLAQDSNGNIFVTDFGNARVSVFDEDTNFLFSFGKKNSSSNFSGFEAPSGIAIIDDIVYVADNIKGGIYTFDTSGNYLDTLVLSGTFSNPESIRVYQDSLLVSDMNKIYSVDIGTGSVYETARLGNGNVKATNVALDANSNLVVADFGANEINVMSRMNELVGGFFVDIEKINSEQFPKVYLDVRVENRFRQSLVGLNDVNFYVSEENRGVADLRFEGAVTLDQSADVTIIIDRNLTSANLSSAIETAVKEIASSMNKDSKLTIISASNVPVIEYSGNPDGCKNFSVKRLNSQIVKETALDNSIRLAGNNLISDSVKRSIILLTSGTVSENAFSKYPVSEIASYLGNNGISFSTILLTQKNIDSQIDYLISHLNGNSYYVFRPEGLSSVVADIESIPTGLYRLSYVSSLNSGYGREYLPVEVEVYLHNRSGKDSTGYFAPLE